ncbi:VanZ family protein [Bacillus alkalicellulosilyticus]|uniref:VanZ family protein n=1 Tax=Alkalihalobacterium alkalicellulosilyticum TaxID=1912214 RepID=UPI000998CDC3|nr:VanZ family protein [Bacillus alkalicellulosilyticus]
MDIQIILSKLLPIALIALVLALVLIGVTYVSYKIYRKRGGSKAVTKIQFVTIFLLLGWFVVVMVLTFFSRGENFEGWVNFQLFSGYVNAWNQWSLSEWQLIIFNMLMFAPLGFLLPLLSQKTRRFLPVFILSLLVTLGVESFQMVSRRGIFELDDILHNTLGSISGFLLMSLILDSVERRKVSVKSLVKALAIPLAFVLLFTGGMVVYHSKEFGNLSIRPAITQNMNQVEVVLNTDLPEDAEPVSLYFNSQIHNRIYGKEMARLMGRSFDLLQKGGMGIEGHNRIWSFRDNEQNDYYFNYSLHDGGWWLLAEGVDIMPLEGEELSKQRDFYESWMLTNGLLPQNTRFELQSEDTLRWEITRSVTDIAREDLDFAEGVIMLKPSLEHQIPQDLYYFMNENKFVRKVDIISPVQAYDEIVKGNFYTFNKMSKGDQLNVKQYELAYTYDSKGYYQPVYKFIGTVNGEPWETFIPALRN